jgi:WD40 repeat protein
MVPAVSGPGVDPTSATRTTEPETHDGRGIDPVRTAASNPETVEPPVVERLPAPLQTREPERYDTLGEHGRGGLGRVLRAHDRELGRTVAIKELLRRGRAAEVRFLREALITARLEHPGIVPVHEAGRWPDGTPFYSMKLVAGRPLRELVEAARTLEQRLALIPHVVAVADAIAYAHARRIVHRDLKPANVIVGDYGETVVIDWGLAKDLSASEHDATGEPYRSASPPDDVTVAGAIMGTPAFMAPEQARGEPGDERADVYALGAMLYAVLTGHAPYLGTRSADIVRAVVDGPPRPLADVVPGVAVDLVAIVTAAMARDRQQRLPSARAFADELRRYLQGQLVQSHRYTAVERAARWMRRHRELSAASAVAAVALLAVGGLAVSRIVAERDVADQQRRVAEQERRRAETALRDSRDQRDRLVLGSARVENDRDPTAALEWIASYQGSDTDKAQELAAIAVARNAATFVRHENQTRIVTAGATSFSPPVVVTIGTDRTVRLWRGGETQPTIIASETSPGFHITRSANAGLVAFARDRDVLVVDRTGAHRVATTLSDLPTALAFSGDGSVLMAVARDGEIALVSGHDVTRMHAPPRIGPVGAIALSRDAATLVVCGTTEQLWRHRRGAGWSAAGSCRVQEGGPVRVSADGRALATALGGRLTVRDVDSGRVTALPALVEPITTVDFLDDGNLAVADRGGGLHLALLATQTYRRLTTGDSAALSVVEGPQGDLAVAFESGEVRVVSLPSGHVEHLRGMRSKNGAVQWSTDGRSLLAADLEQVRIWPLPQQRTWATASPASYNAAYSGDGRWLAADSRNGNVLVVDRAATSRRSALHQLRGHTSIVFGIGFAGDTLVSSSYDGSVRSWSGAGWASRAYLDASAQVRQLLVARRRAYSLDSAGRVFSIDLATGAATLLHRSALPLHMMVVSPDEARIILWSERGHLQRLDVASRELRDIGARARPSYHAVFSADGSFFVHGTSDGVIEVRAADGALLHAGQYGRKCSVVAVAVDGEISAGCDSLLVTLRRSDNGWTATWRELEAGVYSLAYSPDGRTIAVGGFTGRLLAIDVATGAMRARQLGSSIITSVTFSPDGRELTATTFSSELHSIDLSQMEAAPRDAAALTAWLRDRRDTDLMAPRSAGAE